MGGAFSNGQDNEELVDNLVDSGYIRSKKIEQVFRAVDRGDYFLSFHRENAYKDFAWKHGNIHLSAPCIYCEVMEELSLQPGLSFLNLGSGTGYLSTMAGLLLTQSGINHGIELHEDCVKYAYDRLDEFKQKSLAIDEFDFCEPVFVQGNCLNVTPGRRYDRVYCGATCPETHEAMIKEFVKVGGILVMPYKDHLVRAKRVGENAWEQETILPVSFANLVIPCSNDVVCHLPDCDPLSLQELCRGKIRRRLRANVWREHTDLETCKPISLERNRPVPPQRALRQFIIPIFEESDDETLSDEDEEVRVRRTQLLLNVDSPPGENLRTTLQFVRAVIQPNRRDNHDCSADDEEPVQPEHDHEVPWPIEDEESPSTEDTNFSSERERHDSESSSDSACDKSRSEGHESGRDPESERPSATAYENMSESESEPDTEEAEANASRCLPLIDQPRKKACRKETSDSGIVEDACVPGNDDASFSSDSEFANGTPVKHHKRSCNSSASSSSSNGRNGRNSANGTPTSNNNSSHNNSASSSSGNENKSSSEPRLLRYPLSMREAAHNGHYTDTNAFSSYMKEKIDQLPLPYPLKLYINYNRAL